MIEDFTKSIKAALYDRTVSPLFGTFLISWLVCNHRIFLVLLSPEHFQEKILYIDEVLYRDWWWTLIKLIFAPLLSTVFFLYVYPIPAQRVFHTCKKREKNLRDIKNEFESSRILTELESQEIINSTIQVELQHDIQLKKRSGDLAAARALLEEKEKIIIEQSEQLKHTDNRWKELSKDNKALQKQILDMENQLNSIQNNKIKPSEEIYTDDELALYLKQHVFKMVFNPASNSQKLITFNEDSSIGRGSNANESFWQIGNQMLEILNADKKVHNKFYYEPATRLFISTNESGLKNKIRGQYISTEPQG